MNWLRWLAILIGSALIGMAVSPIAHALTVTYSTHSVPANQNTVIDANINCDSYDNYLKEGDLVQAHFFYCQGLDCQQKASKNFVYAVPCNKNLQIEVNVQPDLNTSIVFMARRYGDNTYPIQKIEFLQVSLPEANPTVIPPKNHPIKIETIIGAILFAIGLFSIFWYPKWWSIIILLLGIIIFVFTLFANY